MQGYSPKTYSAKLTFRLAAQLPQKLQFSHFRATLRKPMETKANSHPNIACLQGFTIKETASSTIAFRNCVRQHLQRAQK